MFFMQLFFSKFSKKYFIINFLFSSIIISFIVGNLILNLNLVLIIVISFIFFKDKIIRFDLEFIDKILIFLFVYIILCSLINNFFYIKNDSNDFTVFFKSILFLRYLIFYFVIRFLIKENIINFKIFFITAFVCVTFVCLDIIYQLIFNQDIFGYAALDRRLSGPFGDELIAGSFIQRFALISLFLIPIFFKFKNIYTQYLIITFFILLFLFAIILSGNRIPLIFFTLSIVAIIIFEQKLRKFLLIFLFIFFSSAFLMTNLNVNYKNHLSGFVTHVKQILFFTSIKPATEKFKEDYGKRYKFYSFEFKGKTYVYPNTYVKELVSGIIIWSDRKIFGGGVKSFRINCSKSKVLNCSTHPHNYYIELLADLGFVGFLIVFIIFSFLFIKIFITKYFKKSHLNNYHLITPFIFLFFTEIFPIKTTGSFFSTNNATYIFLIMAIMLQLSKNKKSIE